MVLPRSGSEPAGDASASDGYLARPGRLVALAVLVLGLGGAGIWFAFGGQSGEDHGFCDDATLTVHSVSPRLDQPFGALGDAEVDVEYSINERFGTGHLVQLSVEWSAAAATPDRPRSGTFVALLELRDVADRITVQAQSMTPLAVPAERTVRQLTAQDRVEAIDVTLSAVAPDFTDLDRPQAAHSISFRQRSDLGGVPEVRCSNAG